MNFFTGNFFLSFLILIKLFLKPRKNLDSVSDETSDSLGELSVGRDVEGVEAFAKQPDEVRREREQPQERRHRKRRRAVAVDAVDAIDLQKVPVAPKKIEL